MAKIYRLLPKFTGLEIGIEQNSLIYFSKLGNGTTEWH